MTIKRNKLVKLLIFSVACLATPARAQCVGDLVPDGRIDGGDLGVLLAYWGPTSSSSFSIASDMNQDGFVDGTDLGTLLGRWGGCAPVVTSVSPNTGSPSGGTPVSISGGYFVGVTAVNFGSIPAASFTIVSPTQITATTPPGVLGAVSVEVSSPAGSSSLVGGFTYANLAVPSWATLIESLPDPAVITDPSLRQKIASSGWAWRVRHTATQIEMLLVPPGTFQMGCSQWAEASCSQPEYPVHGVTISSAFYLGRFEVTQSQWQARMGSNPSEFGFYPDSSVRPVNRVSWEDIQQFLSLSGMRLPTEAEWEYACRAETTTAYHNGSNSWLEVGGIGWWSSNAGNQARPVGLKEPNRLGLHDMAGNISEWVSDWYSETYYSTSPAIDPAGPTSGADRVIRGGCWNCHWYQLRSSDRWRAWPAAVSGAVGFRVARNP